MQSTLSEWGGSSSPSCPRRWHGGGMAVLSALGHYQLALILFKVTVKNPQTLS